jgi:hypothetical protein
MVSALLGSALGLLGIAETGSSKDKKKGKGKKKRKGEKKPTCSDGIQNGGETDVDCSGPCARCANGKRCVSGDQINRNHCESASCSVFGYCFACTEASHCPGDLFGSCRCQDGTCIRTDPDPVPRGFCDDCPAGTAWCNDLGFVKACHKRCGAI